MKKCLAKSRETQLRSLDNQLAIKAMIVTEQIFKESIMLATQTILLVKAQKCSLNRLMKKMKT